MSFITDLLRIIYLGVYLNTKTKIGGSVCFLLTQWCNKFDLSALKVDLFVICLILIHILLYIIMTIIVDLFYAISI